MLQTAAQSFREGTLSRDELQALLHGVTATIDPATRPSPQGAKLARDELEESFTGQLDSRRSLPAAPPPGPDTPLDVSSSDDDRDTIGTAGTRAFVQSLEQLQAQLGSLMRQ